MKVVCRLRDLRLLDYHQQTLLLSCMIQHAIHIREALPGGGPMSLSKARRAPEEIDYS